MLDFFQVVKFYKLVRTFAKMPIKCKKFYLLSQISEVYVQNLSFIRFKYHHIGNIGVTWRQEATAPLPQTRNGERFKEKRLEMNENG